MVGGIIESLQCRRPFSPSSFHRKQSHSAPIPVTHALTLLIPLTLRGNLAWHIPHTYTSLECGRKPEETHSDTGRLCKLYTDSDLRPELNPAPWRCDAAVLTTVPPCRPQPEHPEETHANTGRISPVPSRVVTTTVHSPVTGLELVFIIMES